MAKNSVGRWILKNLGDRLRNLTRGKREIPLEGVSTIGRFGGRKYYTLPIDEVPVRDAETARELLEAVKWSRHARHCLSYAIRDVFGSSDGDDQGWTVAPTIEGGDRIDTEIYDLIMDLKNRKFDGEYVIGGDKMQRALRDALAYGDSFLTWSAAMTGGKWGLTRTMYLPTWQMYRCQDDTGLLTHYEQRCGWGDDVIRFEPVQVVQISHERLGNYGQSIFLQSLGAWADIKDARMDLADAARAIGVNPNLHIMPEGTSIEQRDMYREQYEDQKKDGAILDLYLDSGAEIRKLSNSNPDLKALAQYVEATEKRIIPPGFPIYYFPEFEASGARDIAGQPAIAYMRMRNQWCGMVATGLRQLIDIELILKLGWDEFQRRGQYRIVFPKWKLNLSEPDADESDLPGIQDLDRFIPMTTQQRNGALR